MRKTNKAGLELIKTWEGCRLRAYKDTGGVLTIGYGHTANVQEGQNITLEQAEELLKKDLELAERQVDHMVTVHLTDNQFAALVSLVFNIGGGNFHDSTLRKRLNEGKYTEAANWFTPWCKVKGVESEGLLHRRHAEMMLFKTPDGPKA